MHLTHLAHSPGPHIQSRPIKISGNESTKSSSSTTSTGSSSADSSERMLLSKQSACAKSSISSVATTTTSNSTPNVDDTDFHYEAIVDPNMSKPKYTYHDEPHSFENTMEFLDDYKNFQYEVLETTV